MTIMTEAKKRLASVAQPVDATQYPEPRLTELTNLMDALQAIGDQVRRKMAAYNAGPHT